MTLTADMNRKLHALATEMVGKEHAHQALHDMCVNSYGVNSLGALTEKQAVALQVGLQKVVNEKRASTLPRTDAGQAPAMTADGVKLATAAQVQYATKLLEQLEWSEQYMTEMLWNKYQHRFVGLDKIPSWMMIRVIDFMKSRASSSLSMTR